MNFKTVQEAFNHYRNSSLEAIEKRAAEIRELVNTDDTADVDSLNIELDGMNQAKANMIERRSGQGSLDPLLSSLSSMNFDSRASQESVTGDVFDSPEYRSAFFKTLVGQELTQPESAAYTRAGEIVVAERRADAFANSSNTAAILPTRTLNEILSKARTRGGLLSVCRRFNIPAKLAIPVATPSANAEWHTEGAEVKSTKPSIVNVMFDGYEILKIFSISAKVRRMSIQAFEQYLIDELTACVMGTIENSLVHGTGKNQGSGLETIEWNNTNSITYTDNVTYANIVAALAMLKAGYSAGASWAMNNATLYSQVYSITDTNKRPIFIADPKQEQIGHLLSRPVVVDDNIDDNVLYLGDFQFLGYNLVEAPLIEVSRESSFNRGLIDYRALATADTKPIIEEAFVKLTPGTGS